MLEIKNLSFTAPDGKEIIKDLSLTVPDNKIVAVTGPNGGGKAHLPS